VTLGGMRWGWIEMEVEPLEVKYKWSEMCKEMPCKSSDCYPKGVVLLWMIVPCPRHNKIQLAMIYVSMDQQVKLVVFNLQQ
jgi:hypothetical protein